MSYVYVVTTPMFLVMKRKGDEVKPRNSNLKTKKKNVFLLSISVDEF